MKKGISLFTIILLLFFTTQSFAQVRFGLKAGLNLANMTDKDDDDTYSNDYKMKPGFHLGVTAEISISDKFAFEPGLLFTTKGFKVTESGYSGKANLNYLEVPMNAVFKHDLGTAKLLIFAGPYVGFALSGKATGDGDDYTFKIGTNSDEDDLKPLDLGLNFGAGVEIKSITISLQYGFSLANIAAYSDNGTKLTNKVLGISLGYKFGGK